MNNRAHSNAVTRARLASFYRRATDALGRLSDVAPLLVRLSLGVMFAQSGWGKFAHLERTIGFFESLGIFMPRLQAPFVAGVELFGGILLVLGLGTRLAALPLAITMVVALITAQLPEVESLLSAVSLDESLYLAVLLWLIAHGPGRLSVDALFPRVALHETAQSEVVLEISKGKTQV